MINNHSITDKQYRILSVICEGNGKAEDGAIIPVDLDELLSRLSYHTTKQSMQFSIRALVNRGLIVKGEEKRRAAKRATYSPTRLAIQIMGKASPSYIEDSDFSIF